MVKVKTKLNSPVDKYFEVQGSTGEELFAALKKRGNAGVFRGYGYLEPKPSETDIQWIEVRCDPTITLPKWKDAGKAEPKLKKGWDKVVALSKSHEMGHFRDFKKRMKTLAKELAKAETLDQKTLDKLILQMRLQGLRDRNEHHEHRLEKDWARIEKFLTEK